jgi:hypothetical protein
VAPGSNERAICTWAILGATSPSSYRNVTAVATGSGGVAILADALGSTSKATVNLVNVIARGGPGGADLQAITDSSGGQATIIATRSNYETESVVGTQADISNGGGNQLFNAPLFVNAAAGDYRQAAGSPTIDAGANEPINGAFDFEGDPRQIGTTDIGADEFIIAPAATTGPAGAVTDQSATLSGSVTANGIPTSYRFEYGPTLAYGGTTPATGVGTGLSAVAAIATVGGLSPATTYHYRLVASNAGGVTTGADQTFTTASPQPTPTSPPPAPTSTATTSTATSTTTAPRPAFAGVKLVSSRLSFGGRFVALKLSCPAGTVGRCSGRTKLTARRQAGSGAASTVIVGRAPFSIAARGHARVRVRVSRAGRRLLTRVRRLKGKDTNAARNGAGQSKTTVAAVTIRRRPR